MGNDENEMRPDCAAGFAKVEVAVAGFTQAVNEFRAQGTDFHGRLAAVEVTAKSSLEELKTDVLPELKKIPLQVKQALTEHKQECPAYGYAMDRARRVTKSSPPIRAMPKGGASFGSLPSSSSLKWILYISVALGGMIAGAGATLGYWEINREAKASEVSAP